jgi:peptide/nickel transport system substrate-binding protein
VGIDQAPTTCNPNAGGGDRQASQLVLAPVLPSAFTVNAKGIAEVNPSLLDQAEVVSTSPQTIVYTINPKAVWSDGSPITAADFVYAWQQQAGVTNTNTVPDPATSQLGYQDIQSVTGSKGGRTVTVVFTTPFADWRMLFADLLPAHVMERVGWNPPCTSVDPAIDLSGGPFVIESVAPTEVVLARNPKWWGPAANVDRLVVRMAASTSELATWVRDGDVQVAQPSAFDPVYLNAVSSAPGVESEEKASAIFLQLDFASTSTTTDDATIRSAIAQAVDRQELLAGVVGWADSSIQPAQSHLYSQGQSAYPNLSGPVNGLAGTTVPTTASTSGSVYGPTGDLAESTHLLELRGCTKAADGTWLLPTGSPLVLHVGLDTGDAFANRSGSLLVSQLQHEKFTVQVTPAPSTSATGALLASGAVDMAVVPMFASAYPTQATAWYTPTLGPPGYFGSQNWMNLSDPAVGNLLSSAGRQLNPVTAQPMYNQVDQILWSQMVALPLYAEPYTLAWSVRTNGVTDSPFSADLLWYAQNWALAVPEPKGSSATPTVPSRD